MDEILHHLRNPGMIDLLVTTKQKVVSHGFNVERSGFRPSTAGDPVEAHAAFGRLVGSHGSGVGAAMLWLPSAAAVLEFMPRGCWRFGPNLAVAQ